jgi:hypothetical protein
MPPPIRLINFGDHVLNWSPTLNKFTVRPRYQNSTTVNNIGLGNAVISFNMSNPPINGVILPITGETNANKLVPLSPFKWKRWNAYPVSTITRNTSLIGFNNWSVAITYEEATTCNVEEVKATTITQNGYGCEDVISPAPRLY